MGDSCGRCGFCCSFMGDVFGILEDLGSFEYRIQYLITGIQQIVKVDSDKKILFSESLILDKRPMACPFLRERGDGFVICTVYQTRPELCRIYLCSQDERERIAGLKKNDRRGETDECGRYMRFPQGAPDLMIIDQFILNKTNFTQ